MADDFPLPKWAQDRRTLISVNIATGAMLTTLLVLAALAAPNILRSAVDTLFALPLLIGLATLLLLVGGARRVVLGPARKQKINPTPLVVAYFLAALPLGFSGLSLGTLVILALVFQLPPRFDLVQAFLLLLVVFVVFSMSVKIILNAQLLMRHWADR